MTAEEIAALFTRGDGSFLCARWGRPMVPVVFGVEAGTLPVIKGAFEAVARLTGQALAETDPELGANVMVFFVRDWDELRGVPNLDRLVEGFAPLVDRLEAAGANQYRVFRFDARGAIRACFVFLRMDAHLASLPAEVLALHQAVQTVLLWSDRAFAERSPLAEAGGGVILRPDLGAVIRAAYDPVLPEVARDPSHALRIAARLDAGRA
ncbi:MAG: hypothetical protein KF887_18205 [Paracoccaceae bacterium]|nr:MAG: hypothetical protein KF887_18205 [Paracoccaceae bacterium]